MHYVFFIYADYTCQKLPVYPTFPDKDKINISSFLNKRTDEPYTEICPIST